jgi:hypothetical protein
LYCISIVARGGGEREEEGDGCCGEQDADEGVVERRRRLHLLDAADVSTVLAERKCY